MGRGRAYIWRIYNRTKESLSNEQNSGDQILFEFTQFFKLQNVVKN